MVGWYRFRRAAARNVAAATALATVALVQPAAGEGLGQFIETSCDFEAKPWCQLPGDPASSYITRSVALKLSRNDEAARDRLWGWGSAATDGHRMYFFGGGHHHYRGNDIKVYDFETLSWKRLYDPAYVTAKTHPAGNRRYIPEVGPRSVHVYDGLAYSPRTNALYLWGHNTFYAWEFDLDVWAETQDPWQTWSKFPLPEGSRSSTANFYRTATLSSNGNIVIQGSSYARGRGETFVFDPERRRYISNMRAQFVASPLSPAGTQIYGHAPNGSRLAVYNDHGRLIGEIDKPAGFSGAGIAYHPDRKLLVLWGGGRDTLVYDMRGERWQQVGTLAENVPRGVKNGPYGRWQYLPDHDVFVGLAKTVSGERRMWAYRVPDPLPTTHPLRVKRKDQGYTCSDEIAGWSCPDLQEQVRTGSVQKGVYHQCAKVHGPVDFNGAWLKTKVCDRKAALIAFDGAIIENVKITDISIGGNANCVRWQKGHVTIRNMICRRADMGLLGFGDKLVIEGSVFAETLDKGRNHGHLIYACPRHGGGSELNLRDTIVRAPGGEGHVLKTGCATTRILNSVLDGGDGNYSRVIDAFNGGELILRDSRITAGESGGNGDLIGYGAEGRADFPHHRIVVRGGTADCRQLPAWGHALHLFTQRTKPETVTWLPKENLKCIVD